MHIGQQIDNAEWRAIFGGRGLWCGARVPSWYIFTTKAQGERAAAAWLEENGVPETWFPVESKWRKIARGPRRSVEYMAPVAPRYLFAVLDKNPNWDVLFERTRGKITGVVSYEPIPERVIMQMAQVPQRIAEMVKEIEERSKIRVGDKVTVIRGPYEGWTVEARQVGDKKATVGFPVNILGRDEVEISLADLRK